MVGVWGRDVALGRHRHEGDVNKLHIFTEYQEPEIGNPDS